MERTSSKDGSFEVNWEEVDPAQAASLQMALDFGLALEHCPALDKAAVAAAAAETSETAKMIEELAAPLSDEEDEEEREEAEEKDAKDENDDEAVYEDPNAEKDAAAQPWDHEHEQNDEDEDADDGMEWGMSVAQTHTEDDWQIERIVRRRRATADERAEYAYANDEADECGGKIDPDDSRWLYLVAWHGYDQNTWEWRGWLRDNGFNAEVVRFDADNAPQKPTSTAKLRPKKPPRLGADGRSKKKPPRAHSKSWEAAMKSFLSHCGTPMMLRITQRLGFLSLESLLSEIVGVFKAQMRTVVDIAPVFSETYNGFCDKIFGQDSSFRNSTVELVFHGTKTKAAFHGIATNGLIVPGSRGVKVANGSAHGIAIYATTRDNIATSFYYTDTSNIMFVCAAVSPAYESYGIRTYTKSTNITPLFMVRFGDVSHYQQLYSDQAYDFVHAPNVRPRWSHIV